MLILGWISNLYDTYESCSSLVGKEENGLLLLPIAHSTQQAQIEVRVSLSGQLLGATVLEKDEAKTVIPVTEDSCARSSGIAPHPLHDKLIYVAKDYVNYSCNAKASEYYHQFISELKKWSESKDTHASVQAIYSYLDQNNLIKDLIQLGVLKEESEGVLADSIKIQGINQTELFVRFCVDDYLENIELPWKDQTLYQSYIRYYISKQDGNDLCYITGKQIPCSEKHPSKIRHSGDKAKLISANDETGFTYKGRFETKSQALSIGYQTSQEAHNALRWLIEKQGFRMGEKVIVIWKVGEPEKLIDFIENDDLLSEQLLEEDNLLFGLPLEEFNTLEGYKRMVQKAVEGKEYQLGLDIQSKVVILAVDAATTGRLSVTYYRELNGSDYLERVKNWYLTCCWRMTKYNKSLESYQTEIKTPTLQQIILAAYGTEQGGRLKVKDEFMKNMTERLLPCIADGASLPADLVNSAISHALSPSSMEAYNWRFVLQVTCALIKKYREQKYEGEVWNVDVEKNRYSDEFICGCMLAVMDAIEAKVLRGKLDENRATNAIKYFNQFAKNPGRVMVTIRKNLNPYIEKLGCNGDYLTQKLTELTSELTENQLMQIRNMGGRFIIGFESQRQAIIEEQKKWKQDKEQKANKENS